MSDVVTTSLVLPVTTLNAVSGSATGSIVNAGSFRENVAFWAFSSATSGSVQFQVSWDGTNFTPINVSTAIWSVSVNGVLQVFNVPGQFFRAVASGVSGGTVTVQILPF